MDNLMISFYRRAAEAAERKGMNDLAMVARAAAWQASAASNFAIGNVHRPIRNGGVGQAPPSSAPTGATCPPNQGPPYPCPPNIPVDQWSFDYGCPISDLANGGLTMGCGPSVPICGRNLIGANTLGTSGIASGTVGTVTFTAGDAKTFTPKFAYFEAQVWADPLTIDITALPPGFRDVPVLLEDVKIGRQSALRRGGAPDVAVPQNAFSMNNGPTPVDWGTFTSQQEQNLVQYFRCFTVAPFAPVHVLACLWGDI